MDDSGFDMSLIRARPKNPIPNNSTQPPENQVQSDLRNIKSKPKPTIQELNRNLPRVQEQQQPQQGHSPSQQNPGGPKDPHEFFDMQNQDKKTQAEYASTPEYLLRQAEVERKLSNSMLTKPEMQKVIEQIIDLAQHSIQQEDWEAACKMLTKLESTCDIVVNHGDEIDPKIVIFILHNLAYCHQKLDNINDSIAYLEACVYNVELYSSGASKLGEPDQLALKKTEQSVNIQLKLCQLMSSKQKKHPESLNVAKKAANNIQNNIIELIKVAQSIAGDDQLRNNNVALFSESKSEKLIIESKNERKNDIIKRIVDTLESLSDNFPEKEFDTSSALNQSTNSSNFKKTGRNVLRSALGVSLRRPWLSELKIEDLFKIDPIQTDEFILTQDPSIQVTIDAVQEKVIILVVTQQMMSTELRQICQGNKRSDEFIESFKFHNKSQEIAKEYLPADCPIQNHIVNTQESLFPKNFNFGFGKMNNLTTSMNKTNQSQASLRSVKSTSTLNARIENRRVKTNPFDRLTTVKKESTHDNKLKEKDMIRPKSRERDENGNIKTNSAKKKEQDEQFKNLSLRGMPGLSALNKEALEKAQRERKEKDLNSQRKLKKLKNTTSTQDLQLKNMGINFRNFNIKPLKDSNRNNLDNDINIGDKGAFIGGHDELESLRVRKDLDEIDLNKENL